VNASRAPISCPQCRQPTVWAGNEHRPFCSERCRLIDLGAWIDEQYRIPEQTQTTPREEENHQ
jgi:hypothetical protein